MVGTFKTKIIRENESHTESRVWDRGEKEGGKKEFFENGNENFNENGNKREEGSVIVLGCSARRLVHRGSAATLSLQFQPQNILLPVI